MHHEYWLNKKMNMFDSCFLCLDIGTSCVRGIAHHVCSGKIAKSATAMCDSFNPEFAVRVVVDKLEHELGAHFENAYVTGNFGKSIFLRQPQTTVWNTEHKITDADIRTQISKIHTPDGYTGIHLIPIQYDIPTIRKIANPVGSIDRALVSTFGVICYENDRLAEIVSILNKAHIQYNGLFDPGYVQNMTLRKSGQTILFVDMGAEFTSCSIWNDNGVCWYEKLPAGMSNVTMKLMDGLHIDFDEAERIKRMVATLIPRAMDRLAPADTAYDFSRGDVNDIVVPTVVDIIGKLKDLCITPINEFMPTKIIISGGGTAITGVVDFVGNAFGLPIENYHADATITALSNYIWKAQEPERKLYLEKQERRTAIINKIKKIFIKKPKKQKPKFIPIAPSTLCFNMFSTSTYKLFESAGITTIHVDIMDGLYVDKIAGGIPELKTIRANTHAHLHVHLMVQNPSVWAANAIRAGADTIILECNTPGVLSALREIRATGRRAAIAINPDTPIGEMAKYLRDVDEFLIMAVAPGAAGQKFDTNVLQKISALSITRKKHGLKYIISVDGGINDITAQKCWAAGADFLVSGSYLASAPDFTMAVQSLLKKQN